MQVVRLEGADEAIERLKTVSRVVRTRATRRALGKAAALVRKAARQNALRVDDPETGRRIADNIGQRVRSGYARSTGDQMVSVGVLSKRGRIPRGNPDEGRRGNTPHWHLIELGTATAKAQPYLRPALSENVQAATNEFGRTLNAEIDRAVSQVKK